MSVLLPSATTSSASSLIGFNNTGNVCVWPAEEALAIYCLENKEIFEDKSVLELGAGMTGMAAMILARLAKVRRVHITDGNELSVENLNKIIRENELEDKVRYSKKYF